jgi:hypothetical protein
MPHLPKDVSLKAQGPLQYTKCASLNPHINVWRNKYQGAFKKNVLARPAVLCSRAGSLDVGDAPASYSWLENFHGLLSMSSCTVCPCFFITASVSQLASSTGWFFHLTKYSKYCFRLVFLPTRLSSMHSICGFSATGNCFIHWITGSSSSSLCFSSGLFSARNESGDIIKKCTEISRISSNITEIYQRCNHKHRDTVIHDFY